MDCEMITEEKMIIVNEGDIVIGNGASYPEILDVLIEHANIYVGKYDAEWVLKELANGR